MIKFVTTVNQRLFNDYGKRAMLEFDHFCGSGVELSLVFEGELPVDIGSYKKILIHEAKSSERSSFHRKFGQLKEANGLCIKYLNSEQTNLSVFYNYRYDAVRFSHKIFSIWEEYIRSRKTADYLVWIDADIRVLKKFEKSDLLNFVPDQHELVAYLGRKQFPKPNPYSEGGWYAFNLNNMLTERFLETLLGLYNSGEIFALKEWHDCIAFDSVREIFEESGASFKNLSKGIEELEHPFINCGLERYFDHLKGPARKKLGRSLESDKKSN